MSRKVNISFEKGHSHTVTTTVTGITDWDGISASLFAVKEYGEAPDISVEGVITSDSLSDRVVLFIPPEATASLESGVYHYEIALYTASHTYLRNVNHGDLTITDTIGFLNN